MDAKMSWAICQYEVDSGPGWRWGRVDDKSTSAEGRVVLGADASELFDSPGDAALAMARSMAGVA